LWRNSLELTNLQINSGVFDSFLRSRTIFMEYNTDRNALRLREYGRNVQHMVNYAKELDNNDEKKKWAELIIQIMSQLNPSVRSMEDYRSKLWQHIGIISEGALLEYAPEGYAVSHETDELQTLETIVYPASNAKERHYGSHIMNLIDKVVAMEEGDKKNEGIIIIANYMKLVSVKWSRGHVSDQLIKNDLHRISQGKLQLGEDIKLEEVDVKIEASGYASKHRRKRGGKRNNNRHNR